MNNYVTLDGKRYMAPFKKFAPLKPKPMTVRKTLAGSTDVTYGPAVFNEWEGELIAPVTPIDANWGAIGDLRTTVVKTLAVSFTDHYGTTVNVHIMGEFKEDSLAPMWDAATNEFRVPLRLIQA